MKSISTLPLLITLILIITFALTSIAYPDPNLVGWWKLDSDVNDSSGNGYDGTIYGDPCFVTGPIDGALDFDGDGDYVSLSSISALQSTNITICAWIYAHYLGGVGSNKPILYQCNSSDDGYDLYIWQGHPSLWMDGSGIQAISPEAIDENRWYHIAGTYDGFNLKIYVNGVPKNTTSSVGLSGVNQPAYIGYDAVWLDFFDGIIDDVRVYDRALDANEILQLCAEGYEGRAFNPSPYDGRTKVNPNTVFSWYPGLDVADVNGHDVYFGTNYNDVNDANTTITLGVYQGRQDANYWDPCGLEFVTTYYWRIDEINEPNIYKGDVWSFQPSRHSYVKADGTGDFPTIQDAINNSNNGDVVVVADGTYTGSGNRDIDFLGKAIIVRSENGPENCIIDCEGTATESHRGFYFQSGENRDSILDGISIIGGYADPGSGIYCKASSPTIRNCVVRDNYAYSWGGGGIMAENCSPAIENCFITGNSSHGSGGGVKCYQASPKIINCSIIANTTSYSGAGACMSLDDHSSPEIINCILSRNAAGYGGAIRCRTYSSPHIKSCIIYGNANDAVWCFNHCSPKITNCIIVNNQGHGLYHHNQHRGTPRITNSILWENSLQEIQGFAIVAYCDIEDGWQGPGNIDTDPCFVNPDNNDYHLLPFSNCIDSGDPDYEAGLDETDFDGNPRVIGGRIDMGAYESNYIEVAMKFTPQALNLKSKGKWLKASFVLPEEFSVEDVNTNTPAVIAPIGIESDHINVFINEEGLVEIEAAFRRYDFCGSAISNDGIEVIVIGLLNSGQNFYGTDTIKIIDKSLEYVAVLAAHWLDADCSQPDWCGGADLDQDSVVNFVDFALFDSCCIEVVE